ncbi:MAG: hypothetical protein M1832_005449 [Thelocarpon impressellum]|nr:MAG: hypothetical protein M1832_005449 [Thelocarpon impressellum]
MAPPAGAHSVRTADEGRNTDSQMFFNEDTCVLKRDTSKAGIVDVDGHRSFFQPDIMTFDDSVPVSLRRKFMESGILPRNHVLVQFSDLNLGTRICPESQLLLRDRSFSFGDVVKRKAQDQMSGTVVRTRAVCDLQPSFSAPYPIPLPLSTSPQDSDPAAHSAVREGLRGIPGEELLLAGEYHEREFLVYRGWVGLVEEIEEDVTLQLENGSVVVVDDPLELELPIGDEPAEDPWLQRDEAGPRGGGGRGRARRSVDAPRGSSAHSTSGPGRSKTIPADRLAPGQYVVTKKGNLRRGKWMQGSYDPNVRPYGLVVRVRTTVLWIRWLCSNVMTPKACGHLHCPPRPATSLELDSLDRREVQLYDKGRLPRSQGPNSDVFGSLHGADLQVSDFVRFRDLSGAALKYDGTTRTADGTLQGRLVKSPRLSSQQHDLNTFVVTATTTQVTVLWQDLTTTTHDSTDLLPYLNVDDRDVWPGEIVIAKEDRVDAGRPTPTTADEFAEAMTESTWRPKQVGIVQTVDAAERIARVKWFGQAQVQLTGPEDSILLPGSVLGPPNDTVEEVSIYEIVSVPALTRRRGDFVVVTSATQDEPAGAEADWFGEIVDLPVDGSITVRLGASKEVKDVSLRLDQMTVVYGDDDDDFSESTGEGEEEDELWRTYGDDEAIEEFVEYEGGERIDGDGGDEMWMTDESSADDQSDVSMQDVGADSVGEDERAEDTPETEEKPSLGPTPAEGQLEEDDGNMAVPTSLTSGPPRFLVLDTEPPADHAFIAESTGTNDLRRLRREHKILESSLPDGIWARTWESRMDLLRVLIVGPQKTPYALAPFVLDFHLGAEFPTQPPAAYFHSWTNGYGRINPNLYEDGKVCLSLLGTWPADSKNEGWSSRSTVLQVLVSLMGLVLVKEPYYNEAGYEILVGTEESSVASSHYTERAYLLGRGFVRHVLTQPVGALDDVIKWLYMPDHVGGPGLLKEVVSHALAVVARGQQNASEAESLADEGRERGGVERISAGAALLLKKHLTALQDILASIQDP